MRTIQIQSTPHGDAPKHIREAWVGLVLPLSATAAHQPVLCTVKSVIAEKNNFWSRWMRRFKQELED